MTKAFRNSQYNGIVLTFPNGNSISTIWGYCTYSDNHDVEETADPIKMFHTFRDSNTVEIMILKAPDKLRRKIERKYDFGGDTVKGYLTMTEWLDIVNMLAKEKKEATNDRA